MYTADSRNIHSVDEVDYSIPVLLLMNLLTDMCNQLWCSHVVILIKPMCPWHPRPLGKNGREVEGNRIKRIALIFLLKLTQSWPYSFITSFISIWCPNIILFFCNKIGWVQQYLPCFDNAFHQCGWSLEYLIFGSGKGLILLLIQNPKFPKVEAWNNFLLRGLLAFL